MRLTSNDLKYLTRNFPDLKLSYVKNINKKVSHSDIYLAIPKGMKYFAWFRHFKKFNVCFIMEYDNRRKKIKKIFIKQCCFESSLCNGIGTILYGTMVNLNNQQFFFIEDSFYYCGNRVRNDTISKLQTTTIIIKNNIKQVKIHPTNLVFGLPIMTNKRQNIDKVVTDLPYKLYCIQHRFYNSYNYLNEKIVINENHERIFAIKAEIDCDIYTLFVKNKNKMRLEELNTTVIPNYKTSVMMNALFRNIKENDNLDLLEESDDEDEFEDIRLDKYVNLEKQLLFLCRYNNKFKSWIPIKYLEDGDICSKQEIDIIEKKYR